MEISLVAGIVALCSLLLVLEAQAQGYFVNFGISPQGRVHGGVGFYGWGYCRPFPPPPPPFSPLPPRPVYSSGWVYCYDCGFWVRNAHFWGNHCRDFGHGHSHGHEKRR